MPRIAPCLWFNGQAEAAADFYVSVFPNSKIGHVERYPENSPFPAPFEAGTAMTVDFELDGTPYTALNGGPDFTFSEAVSFEIFCADQAEIDHYWDSLTADGGEEGPCGWLKDKYGVSWQIVPEQLYALSSSGDAAKTLAVMNVIFRSKKLVVAELQEAFDKA